MAGGSSGRRRRRGRRRAGARRPGLRRRRLDPDPGLLLRAGRPQAHARADQWSPHVRRPGGFGDGRVDRPDGARRGGDAGRARRSSGGGSCPGRHLRPRRSSPPATASRAGSGSLASVAPVITDSPVDPECVAAWEDASRLLESLGHEVVDVAVPLPPRGGPGLRDLLGGAHRAVGRAARAGAPAAPAHPLALRARAGRSAGRSSGWRSGRCAATPRTR